MIRKPLPTEIQAERNQAMKDYHEDLAAVRDRTAKLRAARLARDAADAAQKKNGADAPQKKNGKAKT